MFHHLCDDETRPVPVSTFITQVAALTKYFDIENVSLGNAGNLELLDPEYFSDLVNWFSTLEQPTSLLSNYSNVDQLIRNSQYADTLIVSLNTQRPYNSTHERVLMCTPSYVKQHVTIVSVLIGELYKRPIINTLQYYERFQCNAVTFNHFDQTAYTSYISPITPEQYGSWLENIAKEYYEGKYSYKITNLDFLSCPEVVDSIGVVDVYLHQGQYGCFVGHGITKRLQFVDTIEELVTLLQHNIGIILKSVRKCFQCKWYDSCDIKQAVNTSKDCVLQTNFDNIEKWRRQVT